MKTFALLLLALPLAAPAQEAGPAVPGGHLYVGLGLYGLRSAPGTGIGVSLDAQFELGRLFVGTGVVVGGVTHQSFIIWLGARAGYVFTDHPTIAPFVALGLGSFQQGESTTVNMFEPSWAFTPEAGVMLFRGNRLGRASASVQGFLLTSTARQASPTRPGDQLTHWVALVLRLML
jgi:hypothetical protein